MHFHLIWSSSGFDSARFDHYHDAVDAARESLKNVAPNSTFDVEMFDDPCPLCLRANGDG
jgi:hypothetical protein